MDMGPEVIHDLPIGHVCRADRLAGAAEKAMVNVRRQFGRQFKCALRPSLNQ